MRMSGTFLIISVLEIVSSSLAASRQNLRKAPSREGGGPGPNQVEVNVETGKVPSLYVLAFLIAYFVLGATLFSQWEEWSFLEGLYFSFITLTTIGNRSVSLGT